MIDRMLLRLKRTLARTWRRIPRVPRTVARNVLIVWFAVIAAVGAGTAWRMYAVDDAALLRFVQDEWRAGMDKLGAAVPGAVTFVSEQKSWVMAVMNSALPRSAVPTHTPADTESHNEADDAAESVWRRGLDAATKLALGYDVEDAEAVLAAALPGASIPVSPVVSTLTSSRPGVAPRGPVTTDSRATGTEMSGVHASGNAAATASVSQTTPRLDATAAPTSRQPSSADASGVSAVPDTRVFPPGPPVPALPTSYADDVRATFGDTSDRLAGSGGGATTRDESCRVLIFHTHTSETYRGDTFAPGQPEQYHLWNSTDSGIVQVGRAMKQALEDRFAIATCHLTNIHDWPSHPRAYIESRATVEQFLRRNPQVELVLDVHRDSPTGLVTTVAGREAARVAIVVGTHSTMHPRSGTNVALADYMGLLIQQRYPDLFRRVIDRPDARFNQDLHPHALLLEIGSYDSHIDSAILTADLLADVVADAVHAIRRGVLPGASTSR